MLSGLVSDTHLQQNFFIDEPNGRMSKLSGVMDALNKRYGRDRVRIAGAGYDLSWHHKRQWMSPKRTTDLKEILTAK
ncbi:DUF4113 domain-containing protein [uncultured Spirosoma sp.]|uniref:DUF4113 domain-containing protein n=1 Tax=uncultured Spirosoma sp. TaxID=278208 RepID=UPI0025906F8A|nr:DUF4113 domain-containing protein [uncultured Spirosoma sp.]